MVLHAALDPVLPVRVADKFKTALPNVMPAIASVTIWPFTRLAGTENTGGAESAYSVYVYNFSPGPCEQGGL